MANSPNPPAQLPSQHCRRAIPSVAETRHPQTGRIMSARIIGVDRVNWRDSAIPRLHRPGTRSPARRARRTRRGCAGGLTCRTVAKARFSRSSSSRSVPPWSTLHRKAPPGDQHLAGELDRRLGQPHDAQMVGAGVAGALRRHVGEHHVGPALAQQALAAAPGRVASMKSSCRNSTPGDRLHRQEVDGDHLPFARPSPSTERTRSAATCAQPPGAAPRSTTRLPGFSRRCLSSISISLKAARER